MGTKIIIHRLSLTLILFLSPLISAASTDAQLEVQRSSFLKAERALEQGDEQVYLKLKKELKKYPLFPYLEYKELLQNIAEIKSSQAERFLSSYSNTPLQTRFRDAWLDELAKRQQWQSYQAFFRPNINTKQACNHLQVLLKTGKTAKAWEKVPHLWLSADSRPDECDPVFKVWRDAGKLTVTLVWERIGLAMKANKVRMARYLKRLLPLKERPWLDLWLSVHKNPGLLLQQQHAPDSHAYISRILLHGIKRLARESPERALALLKKIDLQHNFSDEQQYQARRSILLSSLRSDIDTKLQESNILQPRDNDQYLHETLIRTALASRSWKQALDRIEQLPASLQQKESWRYWKARLLEKLSQKSEAEGIYRILAKERSYHGFLAADRLGMTYHLKHVPLTSDQEAIEKLGKQAGMQRARELFILDRLVDARREWRLGLAGMNKEELQQAAKLAQRWDWHSQAIFTLAPTAYWDDLELRFPIEHKREIADKAGRQCLDDAWVFAVVRQESAFSADAQSPAGARGLMQLMPNTARFIARKTGVKTPKKQQLYDPKINIQLGTAYLRRVMNRLDGNQVLATAAYNAGPHRVKNWLPAETVPADLWIETIPFSETRKYTQRVLTYSVIYDQRLGRKPQLLKQRMAPIQPAAKILASLHQGEQCILGKRPV